MFNTLCPAVYKQLRLRAGLTQDQLASALATSRMTVVRFESGRARPDKHQEAKLKELAKCSDREAVELMCQKMSEMIGRRVGVLDNGDAYLPATALAAAYALLDEQSSELGPRRTRTLQRRIRLCQALETAIELANDWLMETVGDCRDRQHCARRKQVC